VVRVVAYWAEHFGLPAAVFAEPGLHIVPHAGLAGWDGGWAFRRGETWILSVPPDRVERLRAKKIERGSLHDADALRDCLAAPGAPVIGPAWWGCLSPGGLRAAPGDVRRLDEADREALLTLRAAVGEEDWSVSGVEREAMATFGAFAAGELAALAGCRLRLGGAADPCLLTHPRHRGRGLATAAGHAACRFLLDQERLVLYQTLAANAPAVALALRLGFRHDATHLAVRLAGT
jgi:GNAT superfamily N-acetyltransferase